MIGVILLCLQPFLFEWQTETYIGTPQCDSEWVDCGNVQMSDPNGNGPTVKNYTDSPWFDEYITGQGIDAIEWKKWWNRHYYEKGLSTRDIGGGMSEAIHWELYDSRYSPHEDFQSHGRVVFVNGSTFQNRVMTFTYEAPLPDKESYILEAWGNCCVRLHTRAELNTVTVEVIVTVPPMTYKYCAWDVEIHYPQTLLEAIESFGIVNDAGLPTNQEAIWIAAFRRPVEVYGTGVPYWECEEID